MISVKQEYAKAHYIYLAIGHDANKARNKLSLLYPLLRMQFYIGVRTGQLPDDGYKTSSRNRQWKYLAKVPLAIYSLREEANEDEIFMLKYLKETGLWNMLANKSINKSYDNTGRATSAETRAKQSANNKGKKHKPLSAEIREKIAKTKLSKTYERLSKYGIIAIEHKQHGAILLLDAQCMLDFCKQISSKLRNLEVAIKGRHKHIKYWRFILNE